MSLVQFGAMLTATRSTIQRNSGAAVVAIDSGTVVVLEDTSVLDTLRRADGSGGEGIFAGGGAALTATGCLVQGNAEIGVAAQEAGTVVALVNTSVLDTEPRPDGTFGRGVQAGWGATLSLTGSTVLGSTGMGVFAGGAGTVVSLQDTAILDTLPEPDGRFGYGIEGADGAALTATGCTIQGSTDVGVFATSGSVIELLDSSVLDTRRSRDMAFALGVVAYDGAQLTATGVQVSGTEGPGLYAGSGGSLSCTSCAVTRSTFAGALVSDGTLALSRTTITDTASDADAGGGFGLYGTSYFGAASVALTDSTIGPALASTTMFSTATPSSPRTV